MSSAVAAKNRSYASLVARIVILLYLSSILQAQDNTCDRALELYRQGQYPDAVTALSEAIETEACTSYSNLQLAVAQIYTGRLLDATKTLQIFLEEYPDVANAWYYLGAAQFSQSRFTEAGSSLEKSIELDPAQPGAYKLLAQAYVVAGRNSDAEQALAKALALDRWDYEACYFLGRLYQSTDRLKEAARSFEDATRINPEHARSHAYLGTVSFALGDDPKALRAFRQAMAANAKSRNKDYIPHLEFGIYLQRVGRLEESVDQLKKALSIGPRETENFFQLARTLARLEQREEARMFLERAVAIDEQDPKLHFLLGRICYELGDSECGDRHTSISETLRK